MQKFTEIKHIPYFLPVVYESGTITGRVNGVSYITVHLPVFMHVVTDLFLGYNLYRVFNRFARWYFGCQSTCLGKEQSRTLRITREWRPSSHRIYELITEILTFSLLACSNEVKLSQGVTIWHSRQLSCRDRWKKLAGRIIIYQVRATGLFTRFGWSVHKPRVKCVPVAITWSRNEMRHISQ